jgi:hypothetical protein
LTASFQLDLPDPDDLWARILNHLQNQMTRATFDAWLSTTWLIERAGAELRVGVPSTEAKDWLENRLHGLIIRAADYILGQPVVVQFVVADQPAPVAPPPPAAAQDQASLETSPGQAVAAADYIRGYLEGDKNHRPTGYSQVPHPVTYFYLPLLGPAFGLYKILEADDKRSLKAIAPNYWTPPLRYSFEALAGKLNRKHHRYVSGDTYECNHSRQRRRNGQPLAAPEDCCQSPNYEWLWLKSRPDGGFQCLHWVVGQLEKLVEFGLARVALESERYKPTIRIWRMPPIITPFEYAQLTQQLRSDFDAWRAQYGDLFNIPHEDFWRSIAEPHLAPHMPAYADDNIPANWPDIYQKRCVFFSSARRNPAFAGEAEED